MSEMQEIWKIEYYKCFNATEAARRAGYAHPNTQGPRLKAKFADEIAEALAELTLTKEMVLARLSEMATGDLGDFSEVRGLGDLEDHPQSYLVHKLKHKVKTFFDKAGNTTETDDFEIELYNAQSALQLLGKHHKLFTEKHEIEINDNLTDEARIERLATILDAARERRDRQADSGD